MNKLLKKENILSIFFVFSVVLFIQCGGSVDGQLKKIAEESNKECPKVLDQWTRLDSCAAYPGKVYKYFHTVINNALVSDTEQFKTAFKPIIIATVKTNPAMKFFRENDVVLHYQYRDEADNYNVTIEINPEDYKQ